MLSIFDIQMHCTYIAHGLCYPIKIIVQELTLLQSTNPSPRSYIAIIMLDYR